MNKKIRSILFLSLFFVLLSLSFVSAAAPFERESNWFMSWIGWFAPEASFGNVIAYIVIAVIVAFMFHDMIYVFPIFSDTTTWVIAIGLALIVMITGTYNLIIRRLFELVAFYGSVIATVSLIVIFTAFIMLHFGLDWLHQRFAATRTGKEIIKMRAEGRKLGGMIGALGETAKEAFKKPKGKYGF